MPTNRLYFGYARQDRRSKARTPITAKLVANMMVEAGVERILTLDLHATQIQGFFDIPVDNLYASPVFALDVMHHFKGNMDDVMVVSPDVGGVARARDLAQRIGAPLSIVDKRRGKPGGQGLRQYPHCANRTDVRAGHLEHMERHICVIPV